MPRAETDFTKGIVDLIRENLLTSPKILPKLKNSRLQKKESKKYKKYKKIQKNTKINYKLPSKEDFFFLSFLILKQKWACNHLLEREMLESINQSSVPASHVDVWHLILIFFFFFFFFFFFSKYSFSLTFQ